MSDNAHTAQTTSRLRQILLDLARREHTMAS